MAKILSIVWYKVLPPKFGGQKGIAHFNGHLAQHIQLVCLCSANNEVSGDISYKVIPSLPLVKLQFLLPSCWTKARQVALKEKPSHIILEHPYHGIAAMKAAKAVGATLILHSHNIESQRFRQAGRWWWPLLSIYEKWVHRKADLVLFKTKADKNHAIRHFGIREDKCMVIPYGFIRGEADHSAASETIRRRHNISPAEKILLFAGSLDYAPNAKAVENIYKEIAPRLTADDFKYKIIICGRNRHRRYRYINRLAHPGIIMAGEVDDISLYFSAADLFINPVLTGGGIQTKNIDALASDCTVLCFDSQLDDDLARLAYPKIYSVPAGDWAGFAQLVKQIAQKRGKTPASFFECYNWESILAPLIARLNKI